MYYDCDSQFDHCEQYFGDEPRLEGEYTITVDVLGVTVKILVTLYETEDRWIHLDSISFDLMQRILDEVEWLGSIVSHDPDYIRRVDVDDGHDESGADLVYEVDNYDDGFECHGGPDDGRAFDLLRQKECEAEIDGKTAIVTADWDELGRGSVYIGFCDGFSIEVATPDWESFATLVSAIECNSPEVVRAFPCYKGNTIGGVLDDWYDE